MLRESGIVLVSFFLCRARISHHWLPDPDPEAESVGLVVERLMPIKSSAASMSKSAPISGFSVSSISVGTGDAP